MSYPKTLSLQGWWWWLYCSEELMQPAGLKIIDIMLTITVSDISFVYFANNLLNVDILFGVKLVRIYNVL